MDQDLSRINTVAELVGLTTRAIRFYEEQGLLTPHARSSGAYRLYDAEDVERLRTIKALRDDAGFSLAEIGSLLDDERARERARAAYHASADARERRRILDEALDRTDRQLALLRTKIQRLTVMTADAEERRARILSAFAELDAAPATRVAAGAGAGTR
jgi:MerR family copper efflux transcriptional regulator